MTTKNINKIRLFLAVFAISLLFTSCNDNEAEKLFNDTPTERMEKREKELRDLLSSSEYGWKTVYFTDNKNLGGYTFLFDFIDNIKVKSTSDFNSDFSVVESEYSIGLTTTTTLTFTTKSRIHELSDSGNSAPLPNFGGSGYKGDFNFMYYGTENGEIIFRTSRDFTELRFVKATADDWVKIKDHQITIDKIKNDPNKSVFRALTVDTKTYSFSYNPGARFAKNSDGINNLNFGIGFTPTGIVISPAIEVKGKKITEFNYDSINDKFVATLEGNEVASISYVNTPAAPLAPYTFGISAGNGRYNYLEPDKTSTAFKTFYDAFVANTSTTYGINITRMYLRGLNQSRSYIDIYTNFGRIQWDFQYEVKTDGKVYFTLTGATNGNATITAIFKPLLDAVLGSTKGYYIKGTGGLLNFSNRTFSLINADDTRYEINYYDF